MLTTHKNGIVNKVKLCDFCSNKSRYDGKQIWVFGLICVIMILVGMVLD